MVRGMLSMIVSAGKALGKTAAVGPGLLLRRRKALSIFAQGLTEQGLDDEAVEKLKEVYKELGSIQSWMPNSNQ
jgi:hypothetical protein